MIAMSPNPISKIEEIKKTPVTNGKHSTKKDKKNKSIEEWSIKLPLKVQNPQNNPNKNAINFSYQVKIDPNSQENKTHQKHEESKVEQQLPLHQLLSLFIQDILQLKYNSQTLDKIINCAQNTSLSTLWHIQYTNNLSLSSYLINQALSNQKAQNKSVPSSHVNEENENRDESNMQSEQHQHERENRKKKRKIKKSTHNKKQQNITHQKDITHHNKSQSPQQFNASHQINKLPDTKQTIQKEQTLNIMLQRMQREMLRVENLLIEEMQTIHILPYVEAEDELVQSESKQVKKNTYKVNAEKVYPLQGIQRQYVNSQSYGTGNQLISSSVNSRQQSSNFPLMNYEYEMGHNNNNNQMGHNNNNQMGHNNNNNQMGHNNNNQSHYQYHMGEQQHMKGYSYPLVQMDTNYVQHLGQLNAQFINQHGMFPNVNYAGDNFMMMNPNASMNINMNPNNVNMSRAVITAKRVQVNSNNNSNSNSNNNNSNSNSNSKLRKMIDIDIEIDEEDDNVEEVRKY